MAVEEKKPGGALGVIWDSITQFFDAQFKAVWAGFLDVMQKGFAPEMDTIAEYCKDSQEKSWESFMEFFHGSGFLDKEDLKSFEFIKNTPWPLTIPVKLFVMLKLMTEYLGIFGGAAGGTFRQKMNSTFTPNPPDPGAVMGAMFFNPSLTGKVRDAMHRAGYNDQDIDLMVLASYRLMSEEQLRLSFYRGDITKEQASAYMHQIGYTQSRIDIIMESWPLIPGVNDLIRFAVKEAFTPEIAEKFGQYEDFPAAVVPWAEKQGLSEDWIKKYWASHWDLPSPSMGYEMLHRGIINEDELKLLMRALDIMPYWRDKLMSISYNPYTRVDVRRMYNMGVLNEAEVLKAYQDIGYDPEHAAKMTEFTVKYQSAGKKDLTRANVETAYKEYFISREDAAGMLKTIGYDDTEVELYLSMDDYTVSKEYVDDIIASIKDKYQENFIDELQARDALQQLNVPTPKVESLLERWTTRKMVGVKIPSKAELFKFYKAKIIDLDTLKKELIKLGYDERYAKMYLDFNSGSAEILTE